jgi:hypothetical protein
MNKWITLFLVLGLAAMFLLGCAGPEEARVKCPKCGTVFTIQTMPPGSRPPRF